VREKLEGLKRYKWVAWGAAAGVVVIVAGLWLWHAVEAKRLADDPKYAARKLVHEVGRHIILPGGETPAVITVVDKAKVRNIPFLERSAQNGDKMLVYAKARKVVLYRPKAHKVVDVGPVSVALPAGTQ
jgi:hypothetical protein